MSLLVRTSIRASEHLKCSGRYAADLGQFSSTRLQATRSPLLMLAGAGFPLVRSARNLARYV
jgi:hypothetical protein